MARAGNAPVREHPLARSKMAERARVFLGRAWDKGWLPRPTLDPQELWALASKKHSANAENSGRSAQDVADFRERLERLTSAIAGEADLNSLGVAMAHGQLMRALRTRLKLGELWSAQPELLTTNLAPPIIVIGHMRSGTTRVHKLMSADPAHSHTRYCDAFHPASGWRRAKSAADLAMLGALNPWLQSIHPMSAGEVEEELGWLAAALNHSIYETQWHIPSFTAWSEARGGEPVYREFARILRTDAAHRGNADLPRVMKVPAFGEDLPALLAEFPDARLVVTERDNEAVLRSAVSLAANQMAVQSDTCNLAQIEAFWARKIALRDDRMAAALDGWTGPVTRLKFDALNADWESGLRRAYADLKMELSQNALAAMRTLVANSASGHHRAHAEQLKRFDQA